MTALQAPISFNIENKSTRAWKQKEHKIAYLCAEAINFRGVYVIFGTHPSLLSFFLQPFDIVWVG